MNPQEDKGKEIIDIPVQMLVRITRSDKDPRDRAILIARREDGREFAFMYDHPEGYYQDLTVCDMPKKHDPKL